MSLPVKLSDVVEQLSIISNDLTAYLNRRTGELVMLPGGSMFELEDDEFADEEDLEEQPEWMREERAQTREVLDSDDYLALPGSFEIHEYKIMEDFCHAFEDAETSNRLLGLIRGPGAFGRFRSAIRTLGAENAWYQFREQALVEIAVDWLEANGIPYIPLAQPTLAKSAFANVKADPARRLNDWDASHTDTSSRIRQQSVVEPKSKPDSFARQQKKPGAENEIKVFISHRNSKCGECGEELGKKAWITLEENKGALCLTCADLDELVFLPAGDAALTRRSKKYSNLSAVVLKFSKARGRYERQGLLVEERALEQAEAECLADSEVRERRNERARERREELDEQYVKQFAQQIRSLFPYCPAGREREIAEHACLKYSGRVGRSAAAKQLDDEMVRLAVFAHLRHRETNYDQLLGRGWFRNEARGKVRNRVEEIAERWQVGGLA